MPFFATSPYFEKKLEKKRQKDPELKEVIKDALEKFLLDPVPNSLKFQPVAGSRDRYYIRMPRRKGWRIIFRRARRDDSVIYEAIDFDNHDIRREGN